MSTSLAVIVTLIMAAGFMLIGIFHVRRRMMSVEDYMVSRSTVGGAATAATVAASVLGAWVLFSPAEAAILAGTPGILGYALGQAAPLLVLAWLGPRMRRMMPRGHGLTEFVYHRFGPLTYGLVLLFTIFYLFVFLVAELTAISLALQAIARVPLLVTAALVAVATVAYTAYGGLKASVFTDGIQFVLIVPLLLVCLVMTLGSIGGWDAAMAPAREQAPHLFSAGNRAGVAFGFTLVIAILAANLFHQGFWQRVYAAKDEAVLRRGYLAGGVVAIPMILAAGVFGLIAVGRGIPAEQAPVALFALAAEVLPIWGLVVLLVLALALVMSSMDTLLNGIASTVVTDLNRLRKGRPSRYPLLRTSRALTLLITIPAILAAARGQSVLYLFLIADLVCSAAVFPVFFGMFARRLSDLGAAVAAVAGLAVGILFFPAPDMTPWFHPAWLAIHPDFQLLASFCGALGVSAMVSIAWNAWANARDYDFSILTRDVTLLTDAP